MPCPDNSDTDLSILFIKKVPKPLGDPLQWSLAIYHRMLVSLGLNEGLDEGPEGPMGFPLRRKDLELIFGTETISPEQRQWYSRVGKIIYEGRQRLFARLKYCEIEDLQFAPGTEGYNVYRAMLSYTLDETIKALRFLPQRLEREHSENEAAVTQVTGSAATLVNAPLVDGDFPKTDLEGTGSFSKVRIMEALEREAIEDAGRLKGKAFKAIQKELADGGDMKATRHINLEKIRGEGFLYAEVLNPETGNTIIGCLMLFAGDIMLFHLKEGSPLVMRTVVEPKYVLKLRELNEFERIEMQKRPAKFFNFLMFADAMEEIKGARSNPDTESSIIAPIDLVMI